MGKVCSDATVRERAKDAAARKFIMRAMMKADDFAGGQSSHFPRERHDTKYYRT
jgi:hypothetical protein